MDMLITFMAATVNGALGYGFSPSPFPWPSCSTRIAY